MPESTVLETCGIVMPISSIDTCSEEHWRDVLLILSESIEDAGFTPQLVSAADEVGVIQKRIIQNLYENPIVVCDVSAKNPNVMFELGMRLAFDRPTIIIKDDKTSYSFDTSPIEHLSYPRDLRFTKIVEFKESLSEKIKNTYEKSKQDPNYTTFLKNFGTFKVTELKTELLPQDRLVLEEVKSIREMVQSLHFATKGNPQVTDRPKSPFLCLGVASEESVLRFTEELSNIGIDGKLVPSLRNGHTHFRFDASSKPDRNDIFRIARKIAPQARWLNKA